MSSGKFRVLLLTGVIMASSLLFEDVRSRVWQLFQQGTLSPGNFDETSSSFIQSILEFSFIVCKQS